MGPASRQALSAKEFLEECYAYKREHGPRGAFMQKLIAGKCSRPELLAWMKEGYYYSEPAEPNIAAWLSHAPVVPDKSIYRAIARNLAPVIDRAGRARRDARVTAVADRGIDDVVSRVVRDRVDRTRLLARVAADADLRVDQMLADHCRTFDLRHRGRPSPRIN